MNKKTAPATSKYTRAGGKSSISEEKQKRMQWNTDVRIPANQYAKLRDPKAAKLYIQNAMGLSMRIKDKELLMLALGDVAEATGNERALKFIASSDGDFISINRVLLELGFFLQFNSAEKQTPQA